MREQEICTELRARNEVTIQALRLATERQAQAEEQRERVARAARGVHLRVEQERQAAQQAVQEHQRVSLRIRNESALETHAPSRRIIHSEDFMDQLRLGSQNMQWNFEEAGREVHEQTGVRLRLQAEVDQEYNAVREARVVFSAKTK